MLKYFGLHKESPVELILECGSILLKRAHDDICVGFLKNLFLLNNILGKADFMEQFFVEFLLVLLVFLRS